MKKYGCSNIDELVDEVKKLRIKCKNIRYLDKKNVEQIFWNFAKDEKPKSIYVSMHDWDEVVRELLKLAIPEYKKIEELQAEIERLNKTIEYMDD